MAKKPTKPVSKVAEVVEVAAAVEKVSKVPVENLMTALNKMQLDAQNAIADLSARVLSGKSTLDSLNLSIKDATDRLNNLYDVEAALVDLESVRNDIQAERDAWEAEKAEDEEERKREEELYNYNTNIKRRNEADKVAENHRIREAALASREHDLKVRETEVAELRKTVDGIPVLLKKESEAAVGAATNSLKKQYDFEKSLAAKDSENSRKEHEFAVAVLKAQIEQLLKDKNDLKADLVEARRSVEATAIAGLNAQSGRDSLQAVQRTLETNAAGNNSGKR
jgi:hypothetical protein